MVAGAVDWRMSAAPRLMDRLEAILDPGKENIET